MRIPLFCLLVALALSPLPAAIHAQGMDYVDSTRLGKPFAKDPSVIEYKGRFLMYYSLPGGVPDQSPNAPEVQGWGVGIAESRDLVHWTKAGELPLTQDVEKHGVAAPGARVIDGVVHLFYQTYGQGAKDSICHATSTDGVHFVKDGGQSYLPANKDGVECGPCN